MRCVVPSCDNDPNSPGKHVTFFNIPKEPSHRAAWIETFRRAFLQSDGNGIVCANHFMSEDLLRDGSGVLELRAGALPVVDMQVCRICLSTNKKLYQMTAYKILYEAYKSLTGFLEETADKLPPYLCTECANRLLNSACFRIKSMQAYKRLLEMVQHDYISLDSIQSANKLRDPLWLNIIDSYSDCSDLNIELIEEDYNKLTDERNDPIHLSGSRKDDTGHDINMEIDCEIQQDIVKKAQENIENVVTINEEVEQDPVIDEHANNFETLSGSPHNINEHYIINAENNEKDDHSEQNTDTHTQNVEENSRNYVTLSGSHQENANDRVKSANDEEMEQDTVTEEGVIRFGTVSNSRCSSQQEKYASLGSCVKEKEIEQDIVVETNTFNFVNEGISSIFPDNVIDRIKFENEDEIRQGFVVNGWADIDSSVVTSNSCQATLNDRVKAETVKFEQDTALNVPIEDGCVKTEDDEVEEGILEVGAVISTADNLEITIGDPVIENHEAFVQSSGTDSTCDGGTVIRSNLKDLPSDSMKNGNNEDANDSIVTTADAGVRSSVILRYMEKTTPGYFTTEDDENLYIVVGKGVSDVDNVLISTSDTAKDRETEIDEEMKQYIVLEQIAGNVNTDMSGLLESTAQDSFNGNNVENDGVTIEEKSSSNVGVVSRSSTDAEIDDDLIKAGNVNENRYIEQKPLSSCEVSSKVDVQCLPEDTKPTAATPDFDQTEIEPDKTFDDTYGFTGEKFSCEICHYETGNDMQMLTHLKAHAAIKYYNCEICNYKTVHNSSLRVHMHTHSGKKTYKCKVCKQLFGRKCHLKTHKLLHSDVKSYMCDICDGLFRHKSGLQAHMLIHYNMNAFSCRLCEKKFTRKEHLKSHLVVHSSARRYCCDLCGKAFRRKDDLTNHLLSHAGTRPYKCDSCSKSYSHKRNLQVHLKVHTGVKPYSCEVCEKPFLHKHSMLLHLRTHSGKKPYPCDLCDKAFTRKYGLRAHKLTHELKSNKEYPCHVCKEVFSAKRRLRRHLLVHSGKKIYKCDMCPKEFLKSFSFQNHLQLHSKSNADPVGEAVQHEPPLPM